MKKLAVFFPGIGYTADRPLLSGSRLIAEKLGYETRVVSYGEPLPKIKGDPDAMRAFGERELARAAALLPDAELERFDELLFIGKSVGTAIAARLAAQSAAGERIRSVLYTPLAETFACPLGEALAFTGSADPWVGGKENRIPALCEGRGIDCVMIEDANHSLETGDPRRDRKALREILRRTAAFAGGEQAGRIACHEAQLQRLTELFSAPGSTEELELAGELAEELGAYYGGPDWKKDFADDEAGLLPAGLKRGVLSEDGIYNALESFREWSEEAGEQKP